MPASKRTVPERRPQPSQTASRWRAAAVMFGVFLAAVSIPVSADEPMPAPPAGSPVAVHGQLGTRGNALINSSGQPVQLRGVALHGLQWFGDFYRDGRVIDAAATTWGADVVRVAVYLHEGGYLEQDAAGKQEIEAIIDTIVRRCAQHGIYCILDWHVHHPGDPLLFIDESKQFFDTMTTRYAGLPNVIYEIANEPNYSGREGIAPKREVRWADIVAYANEVIPVIRARAPESLVLVGTPDWCSFGMSRGRDWHEVVDAPLDHENVAYVVHAYAAGHTFHAVIDEIAERLPLFVTEWAAASWQKTSDNDLVKAQPWIEMFDRRGISWTYWNFCPGDGVFGCFTEGTSSDDGLDPRSPRVSETGKLVYLLLNTPRDGWQATAPTSAAAAASE
jgi:endoglucanase